MFGTEGSPLLNSHPTSSPLGLDPTHQIPPKPLLPSSPRASFLGLDPTSEPLYGLCPLPGILPSHMLEALPALWGPPGVYSLGPLISHTPHSSSWCCLSSLRVNIPGIPSISLTLTGCSSAPALTHPWWLRGGGDILEVILWHHHRTGPQIQPGPWALMDRRPGSGAVEASGVRGG